jgi:integrase
VESVQVSRLERLIEAAGIRPTSRPFDILRSTGRHSPDMLDSLDLSHLSSAGLPKTHRVLTLLEFVTNSYVPSRLNLSDDAAEQVVVTVRRLNAFAKRQIEPSELSVELFLAWMKSLSANGQAAATINSKRSHLICIWRAAHAEGLAPKPPKKSKLPRKREPRRLPNSWTIAQMETIVGNCRSVKGRFRFSGILKADFLASMVYFQYDTATRLAANLAVRCSDINLETGLVYLRWESAKTGIEQVHWLSPETLDAISSIWDPSREYVWPWGPNRNGLWSTLRAVLKASHLPFDRRCLFHRFRRTTATMMAGKVGMSAAAAALGHTSEAMTKRYVDPSNLLATRPIDVLPRLRTVDASTQLPSRKERA